MFYMSLRKLPAAEFSLVTEISRAFAWIVGSRKLGTRMDMDGLGSSCFSELPNMAL